MNYKRYEDLSDCIRRNIWKIPQDVDLIVGVPRSGMIPALMIAELLNKRCVDIDSFVEGKVFSCGGRGNLIPKTSVSKVLVLDDTVYGGGAMKRAKEKVASCSELYDIVFGCVYAEGKNAKSFVDIYLEDNYRPGPHWLYEWNILHHYEDVSKWSMWDIDGLVCKEPPADTNRQAYEEYLPNAIPMIIPTTEVGAFVTYRLNMYRPVTEKWLRDQSIKYRELHMFDAPDRDARGRMESSENYKARLYKNARWAKLFFESSRYQAEKIHQLTGKPVFCYEDGRLYA